MTAHLTTPADPEAEPLLTHPDGRTETLPASSGHPRSLSIALALHGYTLEQSPPPPSSRLPLTALTPPPCPHWCPADRGAHYDDAYRDGSLYRTHTRHLHTTETASVTLARTDDLTPFAAGHDRLAVLAEDLDPAAARALAQALTAAARILELASEPGPTP